MDRSHRRLPLPSRTAFPAVVSGLVHGCPPVPLTVPERGPELGAGMRELVAAPCAGPCDGPTALEVSGLDLGGSGGLASGAVAPGVRVVGLSDEHDGPVQHGVVALVDAGGRRGAGGAVGPQLYHRLLVRGQSDVPLVLELLSDVRRDGPHRWRAASTAHVRVSALPEGVAIDEPGPDGDDCVRLLAGRLVALTLVSTGMLQARQPGRPAAAAEPARPVRSTFAWSVARTSAVSEGR
jgi:hypothetical protein